MITGISSTKAQRGPGGVSAETVGDSDFKNDY